MVPNKKALSGNSEQFEQNENLLNDVADPPYI